MPGWKKIREAQENRRGRLVVARSTTTSSQHSRASSVVSRSTDADRSSTNQEDGDYAEGEFDKDESETLTHAARGVKTSRSANEPGKGASYYRAASQVRTTSRSRCCPALTVPTNRWL